MRPLAATVIALLGVGACAEADTATPDGPRADARHVDAAAGADASDDPDAPPGSPDAAVIDAMPATPDAPSGSGHLLLSEIVLTPTAGEMIEIANPTGAAVDLTNYYVTDVPTYFRLPAGTHMIDSTDFLARFPAGASIAAGAVITIAIDTPANFTTTYAIAPTYSLLDGSMIVTGVGTLNLTNAGEPVVLFYWDGATDLSDCDIVNAGAPSAANVLVAKSAVAVDGPDANANPSTYASDAMTLPTTTAPGAAKSLKRIQLEAGFETQTGSGNGLDGDDETSEAIAVTWDGSPYSAPTPGVDALP